MSNPIVKPTPEQITLDCLQAEKVQTLQFIKECEQNEAVTARAILETKASIEKLKLQLSTQLKTVEERTQRVSRLRSNLGELEKKIVEARVSVVNGLAARKAQLQAARAELQRQIEELGV